MSDTPLVIDYERRTIRGRTRRWVRRVVLAIARVSVGLRLESVERVPAEGSVLVVANHIHNADPILVNAAFPRPVHFMAKKEAFTFPPFRWFLKMAGSFPVDRGKADRGAIKAAQGRLAAGLAVGIFPEGTRSETRSLQKAHGGAGMIALMSGAPVLPMAVTGTERLPLNGSKGKSNRHVPMPERGHPGVRIKFGEPFLIPREIDGRRVNSDQAAEIIMIEIARLLPPDYRGIYAELLANETQRRALPLSR